MRRGAATTLVALVMVGALVGESTQAHAAVPVVAALLAPVAARAVVTAGGQVVRGTVLRTTSGAAARGVAATASGAVVKKGFGGKLVAAGGAMALGSMGSDATEWGWGVDGDPDPAAGTGDYLDAQQQRYDIPGLDLIHVRQDAAKDSWVVRYRIPYNGPWYRMIKFEHDDGSQVTASGWSNHSYTHTDEYEWAYPPFSMCPPASCHPVWLQLNEGSNLATEPPYNSWLLSQSGSGGPVTEHEPRRVTTTITCVDGDRNRREVTEHSAWYTDPANPPDMPGVTCGAAERMAGFAAIRESESADVPARVISEMPVDEAELDPAHQYADCMVGPACELMLFHNRNDGLVVSCNDDPKACVGWADRHDRETAFTCMWGPYTLALSQCAPYEGAFESGQLRDTDDMHTTDDPQLGTSDDSPEANEGPIRSALRWAFVPKATPEAAEAVADTVMTRTPFAQISSAVSWIGTLDGVAEGEACWRIAPVVEGEEYPVLDCEGQLYTWLRDKRGLLTLAFYGFLVIPLVWWAWRTYAPGTTSAA